MKGLVILGKIELPKPVILLCPRCGEDCSRIGLSLDIITKQPNPCDQCLDEIQSEYWEEMAHNDNCAKDIFNGTPDWLRME